MSGDKLKLYKIEQESVSQAIELFGKVQKSIKRKKNNKDDSLQKFTPNCNPIISSGCNKKPNSTAQSFSPSFALTELRSCLMRHDWVTVQKLFPLLLEFPIDKETIIWRYAFTILLHSPMSSAVHLEAFLNSCVGCQNDNLNCVLNQLITLRTKENS